MNVKPGMHATMQMPEALEALCLSLDSDNLNTRKLVAEILTAFCYLQRPLGHRLVLSGLDQLDSARNSTRRFSPWILTFAEVIKGRGIMGSLVGASTVTRGMSDDELNEYAVWRSTFHFHGRGGGGVSFFVIANSNSKLSVAFKLNFSKWNY
jgi:hypothetical protein